MADWALKTNFRSVFVYGDRWLIVNKPCVSPLSLSLSHTHTLARGRARTYARTHARTPPPPPPPPHTRKAEMKTTRWVKMPPPSKFGLGLCFRGWKLWGGGGRGEANHTEVTSTLESTTAFHILLLVLTTGHTCDEQVKLKAHGL